MSGVALRSGVGTATGLPKPVAAGRIEVTFPSAPETTWTTPSVPTASAPFFPTVATGLAPVARLGALVMPVRASTRWAQTLPVAGSRTASVPPRRSTGGVVNRPGTTFVGGTEVRGSPAVEVETSMGTSSPVPGVRPRTAAPSWRTSRPSPTPAPLATPVSSWPMGTLALANFACAAELTQTPESLRRASWTVLPSLATAM